MFILTLSTNSENMNKIWDVRASCPGWLDMELPLNVSEKSQPLIKTFLADKSNFLPGKKKHGRNRR